MKNRILLILLIVILISFSGCRSSYEGAANTRVLFTYDVNEEEEIKIYDTDLFHYELSVQVLPSENDEEVLLKIEYSEQKTGLHRSRRYKFSKLGLDLDFENMPEYKLENYGMEYEYEGQQGSSDTYTYLFEAAIPADTEVLYLHAVEWDLLYYDVSTEGDLDDFEILYPEEWPVSPAPRGDPVMFRCSAENYTDLYQIAILIIGDTVIENAGSGRGSSGDGVWKATYRFELPDGMTELPDGEYKIMLVGKYLRIDPVVFEIHL